MKAKNLIGVLLTITTMLSACSGQNENLKEEGTESVDKAGNCTANFISGYNDVVFESSTLKTLLEINTANSTVSTQDNVFKQAQVLKNACDNFFPKHENINCKAIIDYKETVVKSNDHKPNCEVAQKILNMK